MPVVSDWFAAAAGSRVPKFMLNVPVVNLQVPDTVAVTASVAVSPAAAGAATPRARSAQISLRFMMVPFLLVIGLQRASSLARGAQASGNVIPSQARVLSGAAGSRRAAAPR